MKTIPLLVTASVLRWSAPELSNPTVIQLDSGPTVSKLDPGRDYIVKMPHVRKNGSTVIMGGRNVVIIGGHISVPKDDLHRRALYIRGATGTVHIEGILIDNVEGAEFDAIAIAAPQAIVQVERVRIEDITGSQRTFHADVIQPWGGVRELRVNQLTASSGYQGIQLPEIQGIGRNRNIIMSKVNLFYVNKPSFSVAAPKDRIKGGFLLWTIQGRLCETSPQIQLEEFYIDQSPARRVEDAVWPPVNNSALCSAKLDRGESSLRFDNLPISGVIKLGKPPGGDFVPAGSVGLFYTPK